MNPINMKKFIVLWSFIACTFSVFSQGIELEGVIESGRINASSDLARKSCARLDDIDDCFYYIQGNTITWWDETYTEHTISLGQYRFDREPDVIAARNIFTTDGLLCFYCGDGEKALIVNELGDIVYTFNDSVLSSNNWHSYLVYMFGEYKLMIQTTNDYYTSYQTVYKTFIYSLPGNGSTSLDEVQESSSPQQKFIRGHQVLINHKENIYDAKGSHVGRWGF